MTKQKLSTPLGGNFKCLNILCGLALFSCTALSLLGVHQSFTGCYWSRPLLLCDHITELLDARKLAFLLVIFEDYPPKRIRVWRHPCLVQYLHLGFFS